MFRETFRKFSSLDRGKGNTRHRPRHTTRPTGNEPGRAGPGLNSGARPGPGPSGKLEFSGPARPGPRAARPVLSSNLNVGGFNEATKRAAEMCSKTQKTELQQSTRHTINAYSQGTHESLVQNATQFPQTAEIEVAPRFKRCTPENAAMRTPSSFKPEGQLPLPVMGESALDQQLGSLSS
jgi:hypothetical protein